MLLKFGRLLLKHPVYIVHGDSLRLTWNRIHIWQFCRLDFPEERKQLLEVVGPELQSIYDDMGIEVSAKRCPIYFDVRKRVCQNQLSRELCVLGSCAGAPGGHAVRYQRRPGRRPASGGLLPGRNKRVPPTFQGMLSPGKERIHGDTGHIDRGATFIFHCCRIKNYIGGST